MITEGESVDRFSSWGNEAIPRPSTDRASATMIVPEPNHFFPTNSIATKVEFYCQGQQHKSAKVDLLFLQPDSADTYRVVSRSQFSHFKCNTVLKFGLTNLFRRGDTVGLGFPGQNPIPFSNMTCDNVSTEGAAYVRGYQRVEQNELLTFSNRSVECRRYSIKITYLQQDGTLKAGPAFPSGVTPATTTKQRAKNTTTNSTRTKNSFSVWTTVVGVVVFLAMLCAAAASYYCRYKMFRQAAQHGTSQVEPGMTLVVPPASHAGYPQGVGSYPVQPSQGQYPNGINSYISSYDQTASGPIAPPAYTVQPPSGHVSYVSPGNVYVPPQSEAYFNYGMTGPMAVPSDPPPNYSDVSKSDETPPVHQAAANE